MLNRKLIAKELRRITDVLIYSEDKNIYQKFFRRASGGYEDAKNRTEKLIWHSIQILQQMY